MRWMVVGNLTPAVREALVRHGHTVSVPAEVGVDVAGGPGAVLRAAHQKQLDVLTDDAGLVEALFADRIKFIRTIVYLQLAGGEVEQDDAVDRLFARYKRLSPGRVYTVTETRVKVRQLPGPRS